MEKFWNTKINDKWSTVFIESPMKLTREQCLELVMRNDEIFNGYHINGNDEDYNEIIWKFAGIPEELPDEICFHGKFIKSWINDEELQKEFKEKDVKELRKELSEIKYAYIERANKWQNKWGYCPDKKVDATVFRSELFSSTNIDGPFSFINWKNRTISGISYFENIDTIGHVKKEIEWFAKEFPWVDVYLTFGDGANKGKLDTIITLRLFNGKITVVKTHSLKDVKYLEKINQLKGSYVAKKSMFKYSLFKKIMSFIKKHISYNEWVINYNYGNWWNNREHYFDIPHAKQMIHDWRNMYDDRKNV